MEPNRGELRIKDMRLSCFLLLAGVAWAQEFEVATIKPFLRNPNGSFPLRTEGGPGTSDPGRISYTNLTLKSLLMSSFDVGAFQISAPEWLDSDAGRFVIEATIRTGATKEQVKEMLRNLLGDRFKMTLHRETREVPVYELTVVKKGPMLRESRKEGEGEPLAPAKGALPWVQAEKDGFMRLAPGLKTPAPGAGAEWRSPGHQHAVGGNQSIDGLVAYLSFVVKRPVVNKTGLTGNWDYNLDFDPDGASDTAPDLIGAVRDQLGLKVESKKGPIEVLVVDHIEKTPAEN